MSSQTPKAGNLSGALLVAHPNLLDPNFRRSIVYLTHHNSEDGAIGVVINRPVGKTVGEVTQESDPTTLEDVPIYQGGPVAKDQIIIASLSWDDCSEAANFRPIGDAGELEAMSPAQRAGLRAWLGHAGWSSGQLETEIAQQAWIVIRPAEELLRRSNESAFWKRIMRSLGPLYRLLAEAPDNPGLN